MSPFFWVLIGFGYVGGGLLSYYWTRKAVIKISDNSPRAQHVRRGGYAAAAVAALPALFFATVLGGNLGGALAASIVEPLSSAALVRQLVTAAGIATGILAMMTLITTTTAVAGAVFLKAYLTREGK